MSWVLSGGAVAADVAGAAVAALGPLISTLEPEITIFPDAPTSIVAPEVTLRLEEEYMSVVPRAVNFALPPTARSKLFPVVNFVSVPIL